MWPRALWSLRGRHGVTNLQPVAYTDARTSFFWHELSAHDAVISVDEGGSSGTNTRVHPALCLYSLSACIPIACSSGNPADIWVACLSCACAALSADLAARHTAHRIADHAARSRELMFSLRALFVFARRQYRVPCPERSTHRVWIDNQIAGCERVDGACLVWCHVLVWCCVCSSGAARARWCVVRSLLCYRDTQA